MTAETTTPTARPYSLKWRLIRRLSILQAATLASLGAVFVLGLWMIGFVGVIAPDEGSIDAVADALVWSADGTMTVRETDALARERTEAPDFWFLVRDAGGRTVSSGPVPADLPGIAALGGSLSEARFNGDPGDPAAIAGRMQTVATGHGPVAVFVGWRGALPTNAMLVRITAVAATVILPGILVIGLITLAVTPFVARDVHRSLEEAAAAAGRIDPDHRGYRLPVGAVPAEIVPLIEAMNGTLARLDEGYDRQKRFLLAAAHELRTPIAILQARLDGMPRSRDTALLLEDVARLATLCEQFLDLERLHRRDMPLVPVDLARLVRQQAIELAPLVIAAGYETDFRTQGKPAAILGDAASLERAIANLVQNAIRHGGRRGTITIALSAPALISVTDEGPGIAQKDRDRIFEAFQRAGGTSEGIGLGLHLVRDIVEFHGGRVWLEDGPKGGARFCIGLPPEAPPA